MTPSDNQRGASEAFGSIIMIAVIATAVSIIGVGIFSQPPPEKVPSLSTNITSTGRTILIMHEGGDPLNRSAMTILVDGVDRTNSFTRIDGRDWSSWMIGDTLMYPVPSGQAMPDSIRIVYTNGATAHVLLSWGPGISGSG